MSSDFESYEQDFAVLTAEITGRIGKVPKLVGDEKKQMVANIEKQLEEARELLEQMELEVREIPPQSRGMYSSRMRSYKQEMGKLEADFKRSRIAYSDEVRNELLGDDGNSSENQRAHLLDNTERLERSSRRLEAGYQIAVETEQIGQEMLENLSHDREKIQRARERLRETDANLGKSSRILTGMLRRKRKKMTHSIGPVCAGNPRQAVSLAAGSSRALQDHPKPDFDRGSGSHHHLHHHDGYFFFCQGTLISLFFTNSNKLLVLSN